MARCPPASAAEQEDKTAITGGEGEQEGRASMAFHRCRHELLLLMRRAWKWGVWLEEVQ